MSQIQSPDHLINQLALVLEQQFSPLEDHLIVGIERGGLYVAKQLKTQCAGIANVYSLNINFYRDDFQKVGLLPNTGPSNLPASIDDRRILLIDDVLYTGRTIRAAMNELFDYGRPHSIALCVLYRRMGRELPIEPDWAGQTLQLPNTQNIRLYQADENLQAQIV